MNLIFRVLLLILRKLWHAESKTPLDTTEQEFLCLPHDCDIHMHMTNSRYASFCDLARIAAMFDQGAMVKLIKKGCTPILTSQQLVNHKEIAPLRRFQVKSQILGWNDRFWVFRHDFYQGGLLKATVLAKGVFIQRRKILPFHKVLEISGYSLASPELPDYAKEWVRQTDRLYMERNQV